LLSTSHVACALFAHPRRGELFTALNVCRGASGGWLNVCRGASGGWSLKGWSVLTTRREPQFSLRIVVFFVFLRDRRSASEKDASRDQERDREEYPTSRILTPSRLSLAVAARTSSHATPDNDTRCVSMCGDPVLVSIYLEFWSCLNVNAKPHQSATVTATTERDDATGHRLSGGVAGGKKSDALEIPRERGTLRASALGSCADPRKIRRGKINRSAN